ncbi:MAG: DUF305 domain-containing protein [Balneolaceae bacterium]|nr:DUF305 domain-containing protein [Balneolaceae bacterium]
MLVMPQQPFSIPSLFLSIFAIFLIIQLPACSSSEQAAPPSEPATQERNLTDLESLYWARIDSSRMNFVQADVDFMTDMIAHHAQALIMSRLAPENDASRSVQALAARIINAQYDEIGTMQKWLRDRGQPVPEVHIDGLILMIHMENGDDDEMDHAAMGHHDHHAGHGGMGHDAMAHHHDMPGMLTQDQLEELAKARGTEFDRKFLAFMIEHHEGAVYMVDELFSADGAALDREIFDLASGINAEQITEIERMRLMLEEIE